MFDTGNARQEKLREELATLRDEAIAKLECRGYDVRGKTPAQIRRLLKKRPAKRNQEN
jgi:xanthine/CO dehydrogenase XdhC/CoxF family maturation factor